jgi:hypothetical protein
MKGYGVENMMDEDNNDDLDQLKHVDEGFI